ncbi:TPA: TatD family hydrolase [Pseudomonas aeruginosa]|uniref:Qat anti-phage system TatD family nuclease QatD n=1 Tax=Pseudomonas TaxID=286 RepID=UPI000CD46F14|nr:MULTISPECIES: Qat anti-phage system TatD family nuclease QatD [Pseudomonas]MBH9518277.1 TatD family hydrolase [Pseudomonas aeruginosa]MBI8577308.1 TatD family hydrolase [Pseudomonas aeruginosa]MBI8804317.1 TatD family hydrolase [Pseudomonas aeruginosa]MBW6127082.1 TatD family hydrolase [Pseudomonas aeruginosa]MCU9210278.1 TatD family hydrolase [Pseudomonas aeruginosa]
MDFHCHLDLYPNAREIYAQAVERNTFTWLVTTSPRAFTATSRVLGSHRNVLITPGLHPEIVHERHGELADLLEQIKHVSAVGEIGLDGSRRFQHSYETQQRVFAATIEQCAAVGGRVLSIHSRQAVKDVLSVLAQHPGFGTAVLHWFTGTVAELKAASEMGCWFSIGPAAFTSASGKSLAKKLPRDRVVPESDGPFAQVDGATVMPWSSDDTAELLARAWGLPVNEVRLRLEANSRRLIGAIQRAA